MITFDVRVSKTIHGLRYAGKLIKDEVHKTMWDQGRKGVRYARSIAPKGKTGNLRKGIYFQANRTKLQIKSEVLGTFKYNLWVNQSPGWAILGPYKRPNHRYGISVGDYLVYGQSLPHWRWTGQAQYMTKTFTRLERNFKNTLERNLKKLTGI